MNIRELKNANEIKDYLDNVNNNTSKLLSLILMVLRGKYMHRDKFLKATDSGFGFVMLFLVGTVMMTFMN